MEIYYFYILSTISILSIINVITNKNPVYALIYLVITFISISGIYFYIGDYVAGALEIIIYTGAIMVLFIFVMMLLNQNYKKNNKNDKNKIRYFFFTIITLSYLLFIINRFLNKIKKKNLYTKIIDPKNVSLHLLNHNMLIMELSSIILLAGLIVTIHICKNIKKK
ncbi:NADH-quinone oxidoreductase subunit J family protein [Candidatus Annandia adelgestsuga]|nr:NADH-quinone oxidoreductase subunit J [Candidatus Annandia adelgestsuga]